MSENKFTPGTDGINAGALKKLWKFVRKDLLQCMTNFRRGRKLPKAMSSFIVLVPKRMILDK